MQRRFLVGISIIVACLGNSLLYTEDSVPVSFPAPPISLPTGPVTTGGTNILKQRFEEKPSKQEQLPEHASTPATPSYSGGRDAAIDESTKKEKGFFKVAFGDSLFEFSSRLRIESLYGANLRFLNNDNNRRDPELDKIAYPGRHTLDAWFLYTYGSVTHGYDVAKFRLGLRNRAIWGNEINNIPTSRSMIKNSDAIIGSHFHAITRNIFWARELWIEIVLNDVLGFKTPDRHTLTMGLFPFSLGRGIALGDAFDTGPEFLGYFAADAIDQFAPGFKLSGELVGPHVLCYDLYAEIADNSSASFDEVNQEVNSQRFGRLHAPQRGFGVFDYILAGRLMWRPIDVPGNRVYLEPYLMYAVDKAQKIEFIADARQHLNTFGLAGEFEYGNFEGGFDTAFNLGTQHVFGIDRNVIEVDNIDGHEVFVFSKVGTEKQELGKPLKKALVTSENKRVVLGSARDAAFNGQQIPCTKIREDDCKQDLFNSLNRFVNPYDNKLRGAMFVCDMAYKLPHTIKVAATAGIATGDNDPNRDLRRIGDTRGVDKKFKGFIGLQEIYSGKRVRSLFVMSGQGRIPRFLSIPALDLVDGEPRQTGRFTNLILTGGAVSAKPNFWSVIWNTQTNIIAFWVDHRPTIFERDIRKGRDEISDPFARAKKVVDRFLGVEWNLIIEAEIIKDLTFVFNGAIFFPGTFFSDLKNEGGIRRDEKEFLRSQAGPNEGARVKKVAHIGDDIGYFVNFAFEYRF